MSSSSTFIALYDYKASEDNELDLEEGKIYTILSQDSDWWEAKSESGKTGLIPSNYVEPHTKKEEGKDNSSSSSGEDDSSLKCDICNKKLKGSYVSGNGKSFHNDCFKCSGCEELLGGKPYIIKDDNILCDKCYKHKYGVKCAFCNEVIDGEYIKAIEKNWHKNHFNCSDCGEPFTSKYHLKDEQPYCEECYMRNFMPKCGICDVNITGEYYTVGDLKIHKKCFKCEKDGKEISETDQFNLNEGKIYCHEHYTEMFAKICFKCEKKISGKYVTVGENDYHEECWNCEICGESLVDSSFNKIDGKYACKKHNKPQTPKKSSSKQSEVENEPVVEASKEVEAQEQSAQTDFQSNEQKVDEMANKVLDDLQGLDVGGDKSVEITESTVEETEIRVSKGDVGKGATLNDLAKEEELKILTYEEIKGAYSDHLKFIDFAHREKYLNEKEFKQLFKMSKQEFYKLTIWKQRELKKNTELF